jgi:Ni,Fe-hydrogenase III large subunit
MCHTSSLTENEVGLYKSSNLRENIGSSIGNITTGRFASTYAVFGGVCIDSNTNRENAKYI